MKRSIILSLAGAALLLAAPATILASRPPTTTYPKPAEELQARHESQLPFDPEHVFDVTDRWLDWTTTELYVVQDPAGVTRVYFSGNRKKPGECGREWMLIRNAEWRLKKQADWCVVNKKPVPTWRISQIEIDYTYFRIGIIPGGPTAAGAEVPQACRVVTEGDYKTKTFSVLTDVTGASYAEFKSSQDGTDCGNNCYRIYDAEWEEGWCGEQPAWHVHPRQ